MRVSASRPSFPRHSEFLLPGAEFALLPVGADSLTHFLYLERPEGIERVDAAEFVPAVPPPDPVAGGEVMPRPQGFLTAGHLYRGIEQGYATAQWIAREGAANQLDPRASPRPSPSGATADAGGSSPVTCRPSRSITEPLPALA